MALNPHEMPRTAMFGFQCSTKITHSPDGCVDHSEHQTVCRLGWIIPTITGSLTFDLVCEDLPRLSRLSCLSPTIGLLAIPSLYFIGLNTFSSSTLFC